jgi:hypothetical protein
MTRLSILRSRLLRRTGAYGYAVVIRLGKGDITPKQACNLRIHPRASPWFSAKADKFTLIIQKIL